MWQISYVTGWCDKYTLWQIYSVTNILCDKYTVTSCSVEVTNRLCDKYPMWPVGVTNILCDKYTKWQIYYVTNILCDKYTMWPVVALKWQISYVTSWSVEVTNILCDKYTMWPVVALRAAANNSALSILIIGNNFCSCKNKLTRKNTIFLFKSCIDCRTSHI